MKVNKFKQLGSLEIELGRRVEFIGKTLTTRTQLRLPLGGGGGEWKTRKAENGKRKISQDSGRIGIPWDTISLDPCVLNFSS